VPLQRAIQERRPVGSRDGGLQRRERLVGELDVPGVDQVLERQVTAPKPDAGRRPQVGRARDGHLDDRRGTFQHPVPEGGRRAGDHGRLPCPQPGGADPGLVGEPVTANQVHPRVQPLPLAVAHPAAHRAGRHPAIHGLGEGDHPGLTGQQVRQRHPPRISRGTPPPGPNGETRAANPVEIAGSGAGRPRVSALHHFC
jgi:hypothetical protein